MVSIRKKSSNNFHSPKGIVAFLFLYESHYSDSQHCGNDQRKQNEASDLSVGCLSMRFLQAVTKESHRLPKSDGVLRADSE